LQERQPLSNFLGDEKEIRIQKNSMVGEGAEMCPMSQIIKTML